ncbi:MAG: serine hydrolase [Lachnospiraceae bacterium]|nr:serine hydrolase [Lachnospiraceae bacterium]
MYAIRLELGRELEDLLFRRMQAKRDEEELSAEKQRSRRAWLLRKAGKISVYLGFLIGILIFVFADISKYKELKELEEELAKRPFIYAANPLIDTTAVDEARKEAEETERLKSTRYHAEENESTDTIGEDVISKYAIAIDMNNDTILATREGKTRISPASMTKVMTVLVAAENIPEDGLEDTFTITPEITYYSSSHGASSVGFLDGETVTVKDLFYGTILPSGADAAVGLATYVAGSHEAFVELMNKKLETLGLSETAHFTNCVGLYDDDHYCTCYDMAMIMRAAVANPLCREVLSARRYTTVPTQQHPNGIEISNWFLRRAEDKPIGATITCAKTGYVKESGNCAASFATDDNGTDIIVVTGMSTSSWRCIYDHIALYRKYMPGYDPDSADTAKEQTEAAGEGEGE